MTSRPNKGRKRPAYDRLLEDIRASRISAVLTWDLDRLHRRPAELEEFIELADRHGLALANVSGDVDLATASGRLHARIMGAVARHESEHKAERIRRKHEELGTSLGTLRDALGHASLKTTSIYVALARDQMDKELQENAL